MPVVMSPQTKMAAYGVAALCTSALVAHYAMSLPDMIERGREGVRRTREAPCLVLNPAPMNPVLGKLPKKAPDFTLKNHDGTEVNLAKLRGRVVLVNFWATWCDTCVVEMPSLERLASAFKDKPFTLLAVSVDDDWDKVRNFFKDGSSMSVVLDKDKATPAMYGTEKFPESFLIDPEGNVRYYIISERQIWHTAEVRQCIEALMD
jgi:peroxiredoxin